MGGNEVKKGRVMKHTCKVGELKGLCRRRKVGRWKGLKMEERWSVEERLCGWKKVYEVEMDCKIEGRDIKKGKRGREIWAQTWEVGE
jgi:hypothetical protein